MNDAAFIFMTVSWLFVLGLNFFCFGRLFLSGDKKK